MPRVSSVRVEALREIVEQLRYAPGVVLRKQIDQAEALAEHIDPAQNYPLEWVLFRLTGYRSDQTQGLVTGAALLGDLSSMVEQLCAYADLTTDDLGPHFTLDALAERWGTSLKTIERYRRRGLIARRITTNDRSRARLVFREESVLWFEKRNASLVSRAGSFSRMERTARERIVRRAQRYQHRLGWSRAAAIERIAQRTGRSPEAVRQVLLRDSPGQQRITPDRAALEREWLSGTSTAELRERFGLGAAALQRELLRMRRARIEQACGSILLPEGWARHSGKASALDALLSERALQDGLEQGGPTTLGPMLEVLGQRIVPIGAQERLLGRGIVALRARALRGLEDDPTTSHKLDRIETDLRWASRLKATLARPMLGVMGSQMYELLGPRAERLSTDAWRSLLSVGIAAVSAGLDRWDPWSQGRPAGAVTISVGRAVARWIGEHPPHDRPGQAARKLEQGAKIPEWTRSLDRWQHWLEPPEQMVAHLLRLAAEDRALIEDRFGLAGRPPRTALEIAQGRNPPSTPTAIERRIRASLRSVADFPAQGNDSHLFE